MVIHYARITYQNKAHKQTVDPVVFMPGKVVRVRSFVSEIDTLAVVS